MQPKQMAVTRATPAKLNNLGILKEKTPGTNLVTILKHAVDSGN
jgi:hypothetical protein